VNPLKSKTEVNTCRHEGQRERERERERERWLLFDKLGSVCNSIHNVAEDDTLKMKSVVKIATVLADTTLHLTRASCPKNKI
jgi:hypothetical protein